MALTLGRNPSEKLIAYQLQFLRGEQVLVVQIGPKIGRDDEIQLPEAQQPFDLVLAAGVPKWESEKFFALDVPFRWDFKTGFAAAVGVVVVILLQVLMWAPLLPVLWSGAVNNSSSSAARLLWIWKTHGHGLDVVAHLRGTSQERKVS